MVSGRIIVKMAIIRQASATSKYQRGILSADQASISIEKSAKTVNKRTIMA